MTRVYHVRDNGCCKSQRLFSCANEHSRINKTYGFSDVILLCEDKDTLKETKEFLDDVYGDSNVTDCILFDDFLKFNRNKMHRLEAIYLEPFKNNSRIIPDLIKLSRVYGFYLEKIVTVETDPPRRI